MGIVAGEQEEPSPRGSVEPPDEDALDQVLGRDLPGYWALATVHVKELAALGEEAAVQARCLLAGRLDEILNDQAAVYQTRSGVAVLVGPSADLAKTRIGASLLMKATRRHLAGFGLSHARHIRADLHGRGVRRRTAGAAAAGEGSGGEPGERLKARRRAV
ncbi:hypothetical protein [Actinomadura madurae]|uniref:hypothetical protein n=1 Tax=Actinomadura madurae TaxID=1993 RepID=UPI0020D24239|nr:hypothetical protein [Actinomadura madurae]MCQ0017156.1 hypothetical protein [Actinomadura madurae]